MTAEELAARSETHRMVAERIAYHEAKAREKGEPMPPEGLTGRAKTRHMLEERIAYHRAKAREEDEARRSQAADT